MDKPIQDKFSLQQNTFFWPEMKGLCTFYTLWKRKEKLLLQNNTDMLKSVFDKFTIKSLSAKQLNSK